MPGSPYDFDLAVGRAGTGYATRLVASPVGEANAPFVLPFGNDELRGTIGRLALSSPDGSVDRPGRLTVESFGRRLFEALFAGEIYASFRRSLDLAERDGRSLRIRLRLAEVPELVDLPWEFLYFPARGVYLAADRATPLVRYLDLAEPPAPLGVRLPLRVLAVAPAPADWPPLDVAAERGKLGRALGSLEMQGQVSVAWVDEGTLEGFGRALDSSDLHVVHFVGHGTYDAAEQTGMLIFEGEPGAPGEPVRADRVANLLRNRPAVRFVVLNACEGARSSLSDPFAGSSQALLRAGVPAVAAMQFEVTDDAAIRFAGALYGALAAGAAVEAAVTAARYEILLSGNDLEWATPALYLRAPNGHLFDLGVGPVPPPVAPPQATVVGAGVALESGEAAGVRAHLAPSPLPPRRPRPVRVLPADAPGLLGRESEIARVASSLAPGAPFELYGEAGIGKTSLLRSVAHRALPADGDVVHISARSRERDDIGQALFEAFFAETTPPFRPSEMQLRVHLADAEAAVELDDVGLEPDELDALVDVAPRCRFLVASDTQRVRGAGRSIRLAGLSEEAAVALVERDLGRPLTGPERDSALEIVRRVGCHPGRVLQAVAAVREGDTTLAEAAAAVAAPPFPGARDAVAVPGQPALAAPADAIVQLLARLGNVPLGNEHLATLAGPNGWRALQALESLAVVRANSPRYSLVTDVPAAAGPVPAALYELLPHLTEWAEDARRSPERIAEEADGLIAALEWAAAMERWGAVLRLAAAIEAALHATSRWGQWRHTLELQLAAARAQGDRAAAARARHQLGSRALAAGELETARAELEQAYEARLAIGDAAGADATAHNLGVLAALVPVTQPQPKPRERQLRERIEHRIRESIEGYRRAGAVPAVAARSPLVWLLAAAAIVAFVAALAIGIQRLLGAPAEPASRLQAQPPSVAFGDVTVGERSAPVSVEIASAGDREARIDSVTFDPPLGDFSVESTCPESLPVGMTCSLQVAFTPTTAGRRSARLVVVSDAPDPLEIELTGSGRPVPRTPAISVDPVALDFGNVDVGRRATRRLTVTSSGDVGVDIRDVRINGAGFAVEADACRSRSLEPRASCAIDVVFAPVSVGSAAGALEIDSSAAGGATSVPLSGTGIGNARLIVDPPRIDFGQVREAATRPTMLSNGGNIPLAIGAISVEPGEDFRIASDTCSGASLAPAGPACMVELTFVRSGFGERRAEMLIPNDASADPARVPLSAVAFVGLPNLTTTAVLEEAKATFVGDRIEVPANVTITNTGDAAAGRFRVAAFVTTARLPERRAIPFSVADTRDVGPESGFVGVTRRDLAAGESIVVPGAISLPAEFESQGVSIEFEADSCLGIEFPPEGCVVMEIDEGDNFSSAVSITLPPAPTDTPVD